ncbi:MAG: Smr/MutS family protein [Candidatus Marinimicrobia bacterium]|nr:Smr/MutS family protein [Candidatus Neomarinimicrobiota bacterium]
MNQQKLKIIDIGHSNYSLESALSMLETTVSQSAFEGQIRVIKIITGHGSGKLRDAVREWCKEQEGRFQAVIHGEDYSMFNKDAADMRADCELRHDVDFGRGNRAIIYIWLW